MRDFLARFGTFSEDEISAFAEIGKLQHAAAKTLIFQGDRTFNRLYFVDKGLIRAFRLLDGEDYTYFFFSPSDFAVDYQSFLTGQISNLFFETLTETTFIEFSKQDIYSLYERFPRFEKLGRLMAENAYLSAAERLKQHQTDDLKTRYLKLISRNPELFQHVAQHYIASYLGVKPQSLSRVRAQISGKKY
ncbi:MAG: Crp/Fnr family transcriptional regulator [Bacteroidia bacterium]|jgi:CRP-like cAMP-binding protein|nr:Crp/Fnr family transcriptional regulator [Bacteroidia bacterium]